MSAAERAEAQRRGTMLGLLRNLVGVAVEGNEAMILLAQKKRRMTETSRDVQGMVATVQTMRAEV